MHECTVRALGFILTVLVDRFIMGSISSFLVHNASVPVSVVRDHKTASQRKRRPSAARKLSQSMQSGELKVDEAA